MKAAIVVAGMQDMGAIDQHDLARLAHDHADGERARFGAGKFLRKDLRGGIFSDNASVAVIVHLHRLYGARQHDADMVCGRALGKDRILFIEIFHPCPEANEHAEQILIPDVGKKGAFF